jgi:hypothetical protein
VRELQLNARTTAPARCHIDVCGFYGLQWLMNRRMQFQLMIIMLLPVISADCYLLICATPPAICTFSLLAASVTSSVSTPLLIVPSTRMLTTGIRVAITRRLCPRRKPAGRHVLATSCLDE